MGTIVNLSLNENWLTITNDPFLLETLLSKVINLSLILSIVAKSTSFKSAIKFLTFADFLLSIKIFPFLIEKTNIFSGSSLNHFFIFLPSKYKIAILIATPFST